MREEDYEEKLELLQEKLCKSLVKSNKPLTDRQLVTWGLSKKTLSHCQMALNLIGADASAEAMIILRAAYEAVIRGYFLCENFEEIPKYEAFAEFTTLRNQYEVIKTLEDEKDFDEIVAEQKKLLSLQIEKMITNDIHAVYLQTPEDLGDYKKVEKLTNRNLPTFKGMREAIISTPLTRALKTEGFQVYNLGSQMTHSSFTMMMAQSYQNKTHTLYTEHMMYSYVFLLLKCCCDLFYRCGALEEEKLMDIIEFSKEFDQFSTVKQFEATEINKDVRQSDNAP